MWKKSEAAVSSSTPAKTSPPPRQDVTGSRKARIGAGTSLKGELYGEEDILIEGRVEGKITLKEHGVIVEESGQVEADVKASSICVAGIVRGNLHGSEQVVLLKTGRVEGDIFSKSVTIETGAQFKGSIDMKSVDAPSGVVPYEKKAASAGNSVRKANSSTPSVAS